MGVWEYGSMGVKKIINEIFGKLMEEVEKRQ
jgi:hypothetical protein